MKETITELMKDVLGSKGFVEDRNGNMVLTSSKVKFRFQFNYNSIIVESSANKSPWKTIQSSRYENVKFIENGFTVGGYSIRKGNLV